VLLDGLPVDDGVTDGDAEIDMEKLGLVDTEALGDTLGD
jgi:hypothetical protein